MVCRSWSGVMSIPRMMGTSYFRRSSTDFNTLSLKAESLPDPSENEAIRCR